MRSDVEIVVHRVIGHAHNCLAALDVGNYSLLRCMLNDFKSEEKICGPAFSRLRALRCLQDSIESAPDAITRPSGEWGKTHMDLSEVPYESVNTPARWGFK